VRTSLTQKHVAVTYSVQQELTYVDLRTRRFVLTT